MSRVCVLLFVAIVFGVGLNVWGAEGVPHGRGLYMEKCSSCHGAKLQGGNAQSLVDAVWQFGAGRGYVFRNIKHGIPHLGMPSYEATLTARKINLCRKPSIAVCGLDFCRGDWVQFTFVGGFLRGVDHGMPGQLCHSCAGRNPENHCQLNPRSIRRQAKRAP